jgi:hypothetical protein
MYRALRTVRTADGRTLTAISDRDSEALVGRPLKPPDPDYLSGKGLWDIAGQIPLDLPPGQHKLTFVVDAAALAPGTAPQVVSDKPGQARHWPKGRAKWTQEATVTVTVVPADGPLIALVSDPALDPQKSPGAVTVKNARILRDGTDGQRLRVDLELKVTGVPVAFEVAAVVDGTEYKLGQESMYQMPSGGSRRSSSDHTAKLSKPIAPEVRTVRLILRPSPKFAEIFLNVDSIWGGTIELTDVELKRHDLEAGQ